MKNGSYQGKLNIYCHAELKKTIVTIVKLTIPEKFVKMIGDRILFHQVKDGKIQEILGYPVVFFDIRSTKAKQFGFSLKLESGKKLVFLGDEPYREHEYDYACQADWLLHEAFCRYADREQFLPYEKDHTTVKDACETGEALEAVNLVLYHTEDKNLAKRAVLYEQEGSAYYHGNLYVPDDLTVFDL
jgi:ribonuclease Z